DAAAALALRVPERSDPGDAPRSEAQIALHQAGEGHFFAEGTLHQEERLAVRSLEGPARHARAARCLDLSGLGDRDPAHPLLLLDVAQRLRLVDAETL